MSKASMTSFAWHFSDISPKADVTFKHIPVQQESSAQELIELALQKFGIEVGCLSITNVLLIMILSYIQLIKY